MPKETVYGEGPVFGPDSSAIPVLEVRWGKNGFVELGMRIVHAADHSDYKPTAEERPEAAGEPIPGHYMSLSRAELNNLIRLARRARNYAYGADE